MLKNNVALFMFMISLASLGFIFNAYGQQGIGTSTITINPNQISLNAGQNANVNYTVSLATGNTWGTTIQVVNQSMLSSQGIAISFNNNGQDPPFSGAATVTLSSTVKSGSYRILFQAVGDDPSTNYGVLELTVNTPNISKTQTNTTTVKSNTTISKNQSSIPSTTKTTTQAATVSALNTTATLDSKSLQGQYQTTNQYPLYLSIIAVIILFLLIIIRLKTL
ncbi:MAG: hypothetical protein ACP5M9_01720 [Candidatus Micrarchaeia archaeon]